MDNPDCKANFIALTVSKLKPCISLKDFADLKDKIKGNHEHVQFLDLVSYRQCPST